MDTTATWLPWTRRGYSGEYQKQWKTIIKRSFNRTATNPLDEDIPESELYSMLNELGNIIEFQVRVESAVLSLFLDTLLRLADSMGAHGDQFNQPDIIAIIDAALPAILAAGLPTWPAHLAKASYYSRQDRGDTARQEEFSAAWQSCDNNHDLFTVDLVVAQYNIDVGRYRDAYRVLSRCQKICSSDSACSERRPEIDVCYGNLYYVQGSLRRALQHYQAVLSSGGDNSPRRTRCEARACHYSGKILNVLGRPEEALKYMARALRYRYVSQSEYNRKSGFYHVAMGEILMIEGAHDEAEFHFAEARRTFMRLRENTVARAILDSAAARLAIRLGRIDEARVLLNDAVNGAHSGSYRRGVVLFEIQRASFFLRQRELVNTCRSGQVAIKSWVGLARQGNLIRVIFGTIEFVASLWVQRPIKRGLGKPPWLLAIRCPCDDCCLRRQSPAAPATRA